MTLSLKTARAKAVFSWEDGPMTAAWTISDDMSEEELLEALLAMVKFVTVQPKVADVIPIKPVTWIHDRLNSLDALPPPGLADHQNERPRIGWSAPVHLPTPQELAAQLGSDYELLDPEDPEGA